MSVDDVVTILAVALSLLASYVPMFSDWYGSLSPANKQLFMLGGIFVIVGGSLGLSCVGFLAVFECTASGALAALMLFIKALLANQATYVGTRYLKPKKSEA